MSGLQKIEVCPTNCRNRKSPPIQTDLRYVVLGVRQKIISVFFEFIYDLGD